MDNLEKTINTLIRKTDNLECNVNLLINYVQQGIIQVNKEESTKDTARKDRFLSMEENYNLAQAEIWALKKINRQNQGAFLDKIWQMKTILETFKNPSEEISKKLKDIDEIIENFTNIPY